MPTVLYALYWSALINSRPHATSAGKKKNESMIQGSYIVVCRSVSAFHVQTSGTYSPLHHISIDVCKAVDHHRISDVISCWTVDLRWISGIYNLLKNTSEETVDLRWISRIYNLLKNTSEETVDLRWISGIYNLPKNTSEETVVPRRCRTSTGYENPCQNIHIRIYICVRVHIMCLVLHRIFETRVRKQ
ncbi:unnamed protein product, partial [Discosporangium mesarthrocarpum]